MIVCPLCRTSSIHSFIGNRKLELDVRFTKIILDVKCTYCNHDFTVTSDINWKIFKAAAKIPNPDYTVIATTWYKDEKGVEYVIEPGNVITLQGFELSTHSNYSPFKTEYGDIIRIHNNRVKRI